MRGALLAFVALLSLVLAAGAPPAAAQPAAAVVDVAVGTQVDASPSSVPAEGDVTSDEGVADGTDACEPVAGGEQRPHPEADTLGWENGCWHDDPIAVTVEDGLNDTELDAVIARTMARVEYVRELEFNRTVPVEVISRETFREQMADRFANVSGPARLHQNVKYEALLFVPEDEDAVAQLETNRGGSVLGYYEPGTDRIVVVSDSDGPLRVDGPTLAHELAHALQDQQFNLSRYDRATTEQSNAVSGLLEGDPTYTEHLYEQRCGDLWDCPSRETEDRSPPGPEFHWGIYFTTFQPYSDGGAFVEQLRDGGGWAAVNAAYETPPASSEQVMDPEKYPDERPRNVTVADRSADGWRVLELPDGVDYAVYGEAGMAAMFISPTFDDGDPKFVSRRELLTGDDLDPIDYELPPTDGWDGDRLYPYATNESMATNETGYVWKTAWDSRADGEEFAAAYVELLTYHGAEPVAGHQDTYRIPDGEPYGDAFYVNWTGTTVVIVNAPSVAALPEIRAGAAPEATPTPTAADSPSPTTGAVDPSATPRTVTGSPTPAPGTTATTPGFGLLVALLALLSAAARRQ